MSSDDLHALTDSQLREGTRDLVEERNRIDAELALTVRVGDSEIPRGDGTRTAPTEPRSAPCDLGPRTNPSSREPA